MTNYFIKHYGEAAQLNKLAEECIELVIALFRNKYITLPEIIKLIFIKRKGSNYIEEMGDVSNLISQFEEHYNDGRVYQWRELKRTRQTMRIENLIKKGK